MADLLTAARMRTIEQAAIESGTVTGLELMERAGRGVVDAIFETWPELDKVPGVALVLCGPGNNGGDGFVVARLLRQRGWDVRLLLMGDPGRLPPDAAAMRDRWLETGAVEEMTEAAFEAANAGLDRGDLIIDAIFGIGLTRPFDTLGHMQLAVNDAAKAGPADTAFPAVVAIDVPSGLDADSGRYVAEADPANAWVFSMASNLTVTFHRLKVGHVLADGPEACGSVVVKGIGLSESECPAGLTLIDQDDLPSLSKDGAHKYSSGHALILSGGVGKGGAARLAARGALRIGAGLVTVGCPPSALIENAAQLDAIMLRALPGEGQVEGLQVALEDERINALCLGPGLGVDRAGNLVEVALGCGRSCVLDADALTAFAEAPERLFGMLHENCVLTPHAGEFARLFPDIAAKLAEPATKGPAYSKVDATREAAARAGCVVLYKGADTVIADAQGNCAINSAHYDRAAPCLATAGSGDVLAGFITGLLARGFGPMHAAETAAWLHVECALSFGPGLIAEDLPEELPKVFRALGL